MDLRWPVAGVCVAVAHTAPSNGDVLDTVVVLQSTEKKLSLLYKVGKEKKIQKPLLEKNEVIIHQNI